MHRNAGRATRWGLGLLLVMAVVGAAASTAVPRATDAAAPKPGTVRTFTYGSGQQAHPYLVYTPKGYRPGQRLPLVVMLHGCQTTAYQQMKANLYNPLADRKHFVVAYPDIDSIEASQPGPLRNCFQFFNSKNWHRGKADGAAVAAAAS